MQRQIIEAPLRDGVARGGILRTRLCESLGGQLPVMVLSNSTIIIRPIAQQQIGGTARFEYAKQGFAAQRRGPFRPTPSARYDVNAASLMNRFYRNPQQSDCWMSIATTLRPGRCLHDRDPLVEV
jgi:hypothetical protein